MTKITRIFHAIDEALNRFRKLLADVPISLTFALLIFAVALVMVGINVLMNSGGHTSLEPWTLGGR